ncbi:NAD(P)-dependent oxidoreductase [Ruminococcus bromii]|nr:NAD(P)-dependent oxidoreductase [Ruminococcus bromii]
MFLNFAKTTMLIGLFLRRAWRYKDRREDNILLKPDMSPKFNYGTDHSVYVVSKNTAVELIKCYHIMYGIKAFIFRLPTVYLWSHNDSYYVDGIIRKCAWRILIDKATKGEDIEVWGDPNREKDMVYVKDFCQMLYLSCLTDVSYGHYNVGTGVGVSLLSQIQGMIDVFQKKKQSKIVFRPDKHNAPQYIMDISNAVKDLGYKPKYNYIDMLIDMKLERDLGRF